MNNDLALKIHDAALSVGYDGCGIIALKDMSGYKKFLDERIAKIPESKIIYGFYDAFVNLEKYYPWAKSIIICTFDMGQFKFPKSLQGRYAKAFMLSPDTAENCQEFKNIKLFEQWLRDNNIKFASGEEHKPGYILPLRHAAVYAGLGIFRKNNFFYGKNGSYYELRAYLIDQDCEYKNNVEDIKPCDENCTLCVKSCRTKALSAPYTMNPMLCMSFLTTFGGGVMPENIEEKDLGSWICGCDDCQDACPHNRKHDWSQGKDFYNLNELEELLQPKNIIAASDEVLQERVIPKTDFHIKPENCNVLRVNSKRVLRVEDKAEI
ncbi:MAG: epoxyqueuosine reductase [Synergistaceae bacterium]|nr:epoxyqueuosine reductase [Synergistaceae bacterium]